jgi:hypothetical protein
MAAAVTFQQASGNNSGGSSTTYSGVSFGTASSDRYILAIVTARHTATFTTSATIGGMAATSVLEILNSTSSFHRQNMFIAGVPTGTAGSVVLNFSTSIVRNMISVFSLTGIDGPTPFFTATSTANPASGTLTIPADGIAIAGVYNILGGPYTWANLTERHDSALNVNNYWSAASDAFATLQTSRVITATAAGSPTQPVGIFASWSPSSGGPPASSILSYWIEQP